MEPPAKFDAHSVRSEKADVLAAIQTQSEPEALHNSVRGQYRAGIVGDKPYGVGEKPASVAVKPARAREAALAV